jgi:1,2-diacylglycerol 3-alpha-glucosyltransferase
MRMMAGPMKILMMSDVYFPRVNGVSTSIQTFRRELARLGHQVVLVAPRYAGEDELREEVLRVPSRRVVLDPEDRMMRVGALRSLASVLSDSRFDLVHVQTPFVAHYQGLALARHLDLPCVATYHTFFEEYLHHYVPLLPRWLMQAAARRFSRRQCNALDALVVPSAAMEEVLERYGVRRPICVIPTGIDIDAFRGGDGASFRRAHRIPADRPMALYVGRVAFEKNIEFLLHVVRAVRSALPDVLLVVAGEGPAQRSLQRIVDRLGLGEHVRFVGYLSRRHALPDCYRAADVFAFASQTETQGLVLLEAMALGVPVVATAAMGTRDLLGDGRGVLVARPEVADFADKLRRLLTDAALRARLAAEGEACARQWSSAAMASRLVTFYEGVLERASGAEVAGSRACLTTAPTRRLVWRCGPRLRTE